MKTGSVLLALGCAGSSSAAASSSSPLWPQPSSLQLGELPLQLSPSFSFSAPSSSPLLQRAAERYRNLIFPTSSSAPSSSSLSSCSVQVQQLVEDEAATLQLGADESYELNISEEGVCGIHAATVWGALHAMESFTQLLTRQGDGEGEGEVWLGYLPVAISDAARFSHRGLLIDSSRHYLPVQEILRVVDTLPMNKFNVLHWHIVDAQSFPMDTPSAPRMVKGAYSPQATYSMEDVAAVVEFASDRGVRVMLEIDIPGHAASWTKGYPEIMADCFAKYSYNINDFALNPTKDETYAVVRQVLADASEVTRVSASGGLLHTGGDEVVYGCWKNDTSILDYMEANSMSTDDLLMMFVERTDETLRGLGATPVHWEEVFKAGEKSGHQLDPELGSIFEVWTDKEQVKSIVQKSFRVIAAPSDVWYLNIPDNTWDVMYRYEPTTGLSSSEAEYIIGGEVAMWGEHVDQSNLESIVYPRAAAVGERLWSPATVTDEEDALARLEVQRCRLQQRGYSPSALTPGYCSVSYV